MGVSATLLQCGQPLFSHQPGYWYQSTAQMSHTIKNNMSRQM